jgi:hypothetical protein
MIVVYSWNRASFASGILRRPASHSTHARRLAPIMAAASLTDNPLLKRNLISSVFFIVTPHRSMDHKPKEIAPK